MLFSFSRDGALPGSKFWRQVFWGAPTNSVGLAVVLAFILGVPMLNSSTAFSAITSIGGRPAAALQTLRPADEQPARRGLAAKQQQEWSPSCSALHHPLGHYLAPLT
jgi:hypothetical protein